MYVCLDCGRTFHELSRWEERHGFDYGMFESWIGCPHCGGAYTETYRCDCCNKWIDGEYIRLVSGERICENCYTTYELGEE